MWNEKALSWGLPGKIFLVPYNIIPYIGTNTKIIIKAFIKSSQEFCVLFWWHTEYAEAVIQK